jgi:polyhydroxybutyrate depolymerase
LTYQWQRNSIDLNGATNRTLTLTNLQFEQRGHFTVVVANSSGTVTSQVANLSFFVNIPVPFNPGLTIVREADQLRISWRGEGVLERAPSPVSPWMSAGTTSNSFMTFPTFVQSVFRVRNPHPRSVRLLMPPTPDDGTPLPMVILLHGVDRDRVTGEVQENYMKFLPLAQARGFLYCYPDGTQASNGTRGWNNTPVPNDCLFPSRVDDVAFLRSLITEAVRAWDADRRRVYLIGHSDGGGMAWRMAHEESGLIAGIATLAGPDYLISRSPVQPVNILHLHGTSDNIIRYGGGSTVVGCPEPYPGAVATIERWATYNGATGPQTDAQPSMDLVSDVAGLDTIVTRYTNAPTGGAVELWTIQNAGHIPSLSSEFPSRIVDWLLARARPSL